MQEFDSDDFLPSGDTTDARILRAARQHFFQEGLSGFTMDDLAHELGMSKKTLYIHFPGKEAIVDTIVEMIGKTVASRMENITTRVDLTFVEKLFLMVKTVGGAMSKLSPGMLREMQRFTPRTYAKLEALRQRNVPLYFGRLVRAGIEEGMVRAEVDPDFAAQFWLQAIRGLVQPEVLERTQQTIRQTLEKAIDLFIRGLLTPVGRTSYEKHLARLQREANRV
jgi:AcrR family transcriptional regulator